MKKILLIMAVAASLFMGSTVFAKGTSHGSSHGLKNSHGQLHHVNYRPVRLRPMPPKQHCHSKRVRIRNWGWNKKWKYGRRGGRDGHRGGRRHYRPRFKWVTYCHHHRSRRGHKHHR